MAPQHALDQPLPETLDHHSRTQLVLGVEILIVTVTFLVLLTRFYSRTFVKRFIGTDDWIMGAAMALAVAIASLQCYGTRFGTGKHTWDVDIADGAHAVKIAWVTHFLFPLCVTLTKLSICITYLRIFPFKSDRIFCYATIVYLVCYCTATTIMAVLNCRPVNAFWNLSVRGKCVPIRMVLLIPAALNSVTDLVVYLWPARTLWTVRQPPMQRFGLIFVFVVGCIVCIAGICRIWYLVRFWKSRDIFYESAMVYIITSVEINGGIIFGSLPAIKPLLALMIPTIFGSSVTGNISGIAITNEGRPACDWNYNGSVRPRSSRSAVSSPISSEAINSGAAPAL